MGEIVAARSFQKAPLWPIDLKPYPDTLFWRNPDPPPNRSADQCSICSQTGCMGAIPDVDLFANQSESELESRCRFHWQIVVYGTDPSFDMFANQSDSGKNRGSGVISQMYGSGTSLSRCALICEQIHIRIDARATNSRVDGGSGFCSDLL